MVGIATRQGQLALLMFRSGDELHGDGGQGARGDQQRAMGYVKLHEIQCTRATLTALRCLLDADAGDCQRNLQLVRSPRRTHAFLR